MTSPDPLDPVIERRRRHAAIRAEIAEEEAQAGELEAAEAAAALDVALHLRIDRELDETLRRRARAEHVPMSALVRRLLRQASAESSERGASVAEVEDIARRVAREVLQER